jgi:hypothetical protein
MSTRFYFPRLTAPGATPAGFIGAWNNTALAVQNALLTAKEADAVLSASPLSTSSGQVRCAGQFTGPPLAAQTISGTVKAQFQTRKLSGAGSLTPRLLIAVVSNDGTVVRGTLLALGDYGPGTLYAASLTNRTIADGDALSALAVQAGDRLVIEIGSGASGASANAVFSIGASDAVGDLPEDETETGSLVPWIEFSADLAFPTANGAPNLLLLGVG